jgi:outer membrane protein assembly factor BamA/autotransporter translocation and assembly factor TamB
MGPRSRRFRWWPTGLAVIAGLGLAGLVVLHTRPVRAGVLAWLISRLEQAGVVVHADELNYSLFRLDLNLRNVTFATPSARTKPFFTAKEVHVVSGWGILRGRIDLERVELVGPRIVLLRENATTNWPVSTAPSSSLAAPAPVRHLSVIDLGIVWRDVQSASILQTPSNIDVAGVSIDLGPAGSRAAGALGSLRMTSPARIRWRDRDAAISALDGQLAWNGRDLSVAALRATLAEGTVRIDGRADNLLGAPQVDARVTADANLAEIAPWLNWNRRLTGMLHADTVVKGPAPAWEASISVAGRHIAADLLEGISVDATGHVLGEKAELNTFTARIAGGSLSALGHTSFGEGPGALRVEWQQIDLDALASTLSPSPAVLPAAQTRGWLDAQWSVPHIEGLRLRAEGRSSSYAAPRTAHAAPARLPLDGSIAVDLRGRTWELRAEQAIDDSARAVADLSGTLDPRNLANSSIGGPIHVSAPDIGRLAGSLARAGLGAGRPPISGAADGDLALSGTLGAPRLAGAIDAINVRYRSLPPGMLRARASATLAEVRLDDIEGRLGQSSVRGHASLSLQVKQGLEGRFDASVRNLGEFSTVVPATVHPEGSIDLGIDLSGSTASPRLKAAVTGHDLAAEGQRVDSLDADVSIAGRTITFDRLTIRSGNGRLDGRGSFDLAHQRYGLHAALDRLPVRPVSDAAGGVLLPIVTSVTGSVDGDGALFALAGNARLSSTETHWGNADLGPVDADLTATGGTVSADVRVPDWAFTATGQVGVDARGPISMHGRWEPNDLAALSRHLGWSPPTPIQGKAALSVDVAGTRDRLGELRIAIDLDRLDIDADRQSIRAAQPARLEYDGRVLRARDLKLTAGSSTLTVGGSLGDSASSHLTIALEGQVADLALVSRLVQPSGFVSEKHGVTGALTVRLDATGPLAQPIMSGSVRVTDGRLALTPDAAITDVGLAARYDAGVLLVDSLGAAFQGATLAASGRVPSDVFRDQLPPRWRELLPRTGGPAELKAQLASVTPRVAAPFIDAATLDQIGGQVDGSVDLQADRRALDRIQGTVTLNRAELSLSGVSLDQQTPTRLVLRDGRVDIANWEWGLGDNRVTLKGGMMLSGDRAIDVTAGTVLDLRLLNAFTRAAQTIGRADSTIRIGGTAATPTLDGYITFANGELRVPNPRLVLNDLAGTITLARDALTLEQLSATLNGGQATIAGTVRHRWLKPLDGQITLRSHGTALDLSGLRAETDTDVAVGLEERGFVVSGTVTLVRSAYREQLSLTGGLLKALQTSSDSLQPSSPSWLDTVRLDVRILTQDNLLVDNNYGKLGASADVRIVGTATQPGLVGRVALTEGGLVFFGGNRYRLADQGSIDFVNPTRVEPYLDLSAVTQVRGIEITLAVQGTPATLQTTLTSSDPQQTQSDLISLLVTGRTAAEAAAGGYTPGSDELLGYLSGELFGAAGRAVGLDVVRIERGTPDLRFDAGLVATETDPSARLTFGKNIGRNVEVVFSQSLRQSGGLAWIVSYAPRSRIELRAVSLDNGNRVYDFRHDLTFGGQTSIRARAPAPEALEVANVQMTAPSAEESALRGRLKLTAGDRFSFFRWQDDRDRLEAFYHARDHLEARVTTRRVVAEAAGDRPGSVSLTYDVQPGPQTTIAVAGFSFPRSVIAAIKTEWTRAVADDFLAEQAAAIVRGELVDRGFVRASVVATVDARRPDEKRLQITVDPGLRTSDRRIVFHGNQHVQGDRLRSAIDDAKLSRAVWLEPDRVRERLLAYYRREGYLNASIRLEAILIAGNTATRTVDVDEGAPFRIREIDVEGAHAVSADEVRKLSALSGVTFTEAAIDGARRALDESYRTRGFNNVGITLQTRALADRSEADVTINIEEGPEQRLRDIVISGLAGTRPSLVSRALKLEIGQPVNLADWYRARRRLYETGVFRNVDIQPEPMAAPAEAAPGTSATAPEQPIRAKVALEEWPPIRLRYGLELNDEQTLASDAVIALEPAGQAGRTFSVGVASDLSTRNLFGFGISAGVAGRYTQDFRAARIYLTSPSMFGLPIISNVFVARSREQFGNSQNTTTKPFVTDKTDFTLEQRVRPFAKMEASWRYSFERNHTFGFGVDPLNPSLPFDLPVNVARLASTVLVDTRNDLVDATRGWFHSSNLEYGTPSLGSDLHFLKYLLQQRYYRAVGPIVLAGSVRLGLATPFELSLIPSERFFAGGGNSVRGYEQDALSPRNFLGDTEGGNALLVWNSEIRFPIFKIVRGVGFFDAGRAFDTVGHLTLTDLSPGTGAGLRVRTPVALIRIDYGVPLDSAIGGRRGRWFFSIGQAF